MGVLCCDHVPSKVEIRGHIRFVSEQAGPVTKFIVAVDSDDGKRSIENVDDIEVEFRYKKELLDSLVDFSRCAEDIDFRYEVSEIAEGFSYKLPDVYVASAGYIRRQVEITTLPNVEDYIASWAVEKTLKHLALLGEYGQGKSVLALKLAHRLFRAGGRIPILITLGGRSPRTQTKLEILADWAATYDVNPKALLILHEAGRLVLIFDGFDEMDLVGDSSLRLDHFRTLWDFSRDRHSKILITGRPNFFFDSIERESSLNVRSESIEVPFTEPIYLEPFDLPKISEALRAFPKDIRSQIVSMVDKDLAVASFRDLVSRPSTLFLAANIWGELRSLENIRSAEVIGRFISHSYERQQRKGLKSFLTSLEREYFTIGIAVAAYHEARLSNHISKEGFQRAIVSLIDGFPNDLRRFEPATDQAKLPLRERLQDREMLIETVSTDVRSCGIIVTDLSQLDTFKFAHKSFFEFLLSLNSVYTSFLWPLSKDKILHHAVALNVGKEQPSSQVLLYALASSLLMRPMNREMAQFSGEILYRLLGANPQISLSELDSKLRDIGIPVKRWHLDCLMWRRRLRSNRGKADLNVLARVLSITLMRTRAPLSNLMMMATLFRIHGQGGEDFIKLHDELELDRSLRIRRHTEREASASMALQ